MTRIVVLGGGFAGVAVARRLERKLRRDEAELALISRDNFTLFTPMLPEAMVRRAATLVWYVATRHGERVPGDVGGAPRYAARVAEIVAHAREMRAAARG